MEIKGIVRSATEPKEFNGELQIGFTLKDNVSKWYNVFGTDEELKNVREKTVKKGNEIEFNLDNGKVIDLKLIAEAKEDGNWDEDMVDFKTLLNIAHKKSEDFSIKTECITVDLEKKYALFKASVIVDIDKEHEMRFEGHGDSTADNINSDFVKPHWIRLAETRSICRALRWYTNNAACSEEEKSD